MPPTPPTAASSSSVRSTLSDACLHPAGLGGLHPLAAHRPLDHQAHQSTARRRPARPDQRYRQAGAAQVRHQRRMVTTDHRRAPTRLQGCQRPPHRPAGSIPLRQIASPPSGRDETGRPPAHRAVPTNPLPTTSTVTHGEIEAQAPPRRPLAPRSATGGAPAGAAGSNVTSSPAESTAVHCVPDGHATEGVTARTSSSAAPRPRRSSPSRFAPAPQGLKESGPRAADAARGPSLRDQLLPRRGPGLKQISTWAGRGDVRQTWNRYGHLIPGGEEAAAARLDAYLNPGPGALRRPRPLATAEDRCHTPVRPGPAPDRTGDSTVAHPPQTRKPPWLRGFGVPLPGFEPGFPP